MCCVTEVIANGINSLLPRNLANVINVSNHGGEHWNDQNICDGLQDFLQHP